MITECNIERMRIWTDLAFKDLDAIKITLGHMRGKKSVKDINKRMKKIEKYLTLGNKEKILSKEEYNRSLSIIKFYAKNKRALPPEKTQYIWEQIYTYFSHIDVQLQSIEEAVGKGFDFFPDNMLSDLKKTSGRLSIALQNFNENRFSENQKIVLDHIANLDLTNNITSIANALSRKYSKGFTVRNTWYLIDALEKAGYIQTIGGRKYRTNKRYCFPDLARVNRRDRDGKEEVLWGRTEKNISEILDQSRARYFGINIFEFNTNYDPEIYVVSKYRIPLKEEIRTVGTFYKGSLEKHIRANFGLRLKDEGKKYSEEDSLIAYAIWDKNERLKWYEKDNPNAQKYSNYNNDYISPDSALVVQ